MLKAEIGGVIPRRSLIMKHLSQTFGTRVTASLALAIRALVIQERTLIDVPAKSGWLKVTKPLTETSSRVSRLLRELFRADVWIIHGCEAASGEPLSVLYAGDPTHKSYIARLVFGDSRSEVHIGKKSIWALHKLVKKNANGHALAVIEGHALHAALFKDRNDLFVPMWLESHVEIPITARNRSSVSSLKSIEKNGLTYTVTTAPEQLRDFYYNMYLPSIRGRHGDGAFLDTFQTIMDPVARGDCELLSIQKGNESIAGVLILKNENPPKLWKCGVRDASPLYFKAGGMAGVYAFSSRYLHANGHATMNLGGTRAFLSDGILFYKTKFGASFLPRGTRGFVLKPLSFSKWLENFLTRNPVLYRDGSRISGAIFVDNEDLSPAQLRKAIDAIPEVPDMHRLDVFRLCKATGQLQRLQAE